MTTRTLKLSRLALSAAAGIICLFINDNLSLTRQSSPIMQAAVGADFYPAAPGAYYGAPGAYYGAPGAYAPGTYYAPGGYYYGTVVAPAPYAAPGYGYAPGPYPGSVIVNPATGRWCTFEPTGWHWCWRP